MLLKNKIAIITGAASGIGFETVKLFLEEGAKVVAGDMVSSMALSEIVEKDDHLVFLLVDVTIAEDHKKLIELAVSSFGGLDICFNNAGIIGDTETPGADQTMESFDKVMNVNVRGVTLAMNAQIKFFQSSSHTSPAIINTASVAGKIAMANSAPYITSKHAVVGLTKAYAIDYASAGIRINMVAPGVIATPMVSEVDEDKVDAILAAHPIGRIGLPREISELVVFLASDRATFINGAYYNVDGGYLAL
ncbi:SDR family oxidoreductase [Shewanella benthica]|nr:SDR family oxidoreductase [Shewanella benthica]